MIDALRTFDALRLETLTTRFSGIRVAVMGDFFLDKYFDIDPALAETSVETGRCAHQVVGIRHSPGAAGTVVNNLAALGVKRMVGLGFTGDDGEGWELRKDLAPEEACASMHGGEMAGYLRDFGPAEVHADVATLIPTLFRIHGGAFLRLDEAREADYQRRVIESRNGKKPLACTKYSVLPAGDLFKVSLTCNGVQSFRVLMRRAGPDDFRLMALTHVR